MTVKKKPSMKARIRTRKLTLDESVKYMNDRLTQFGKAWNHKLDEIIDKHNALAALVTELNTKQQTIAIGAVNSFREIYQRIGGAMEKQDLNILAMDAFLKEVFGQFTLLEARHDKLKDDVGVAVAHLHEPDAAELSALVDKAGALHQTFMARAFAQAREKMEKERPKEASETVEEEEQARVEGELKAAAEGDRGIQQISSTGGPGAEIPEGADVFGG